MVAAIDGQKEELTRLIEDGADVNTMLEDGKISKYLSVTENVTLKICFVGYPFLCTILKRF